MSILPISVGRRDDICDVEGVSVGHIDIGSPELCTGMTVIIPYPSEISKRALHIGRWSLDDGGGSSGLGVAEDFGIFSSPIVFTPEPAFGRVYEALIQYGIRRNAGLSTNTGWPPLVLSMRDGLWNDTYLLNQLITERDVNQLIDNATTASINQGSVGIGRGLRAFGLRGGVGTASRRTGDFTIGVLSAINGGISGGFRTLRRTQFQQGGKLLIGPQEFCAVIATNAPLLPLQLRALSQRAALGAANCGLWNGQTQEAQVIAFSTEQKNQDDEGVVGTFDSVSNEELFSLFSASVEAMEASVISGLLAAESIRHNGHTLNVLKLVESP